MWKCNKCSQTYDQHYTKAGKRRVAFADHVLTSVPSRKCNRQVFRFGRGRNNAHKHGHIFVRDGVSLATDINNYWQGLHAST